MVSLGFPTFSTNGAMHRHPLLLVFNDTDNGAEMRDVREGFEPEVSPAHVLEPTYEALKRSLLEGRWPMGTRLEAVKLADDLGVSMTPVRDCLNRLFGEQMVDFAPGEGFRVPQLSEGQLRDLIGLNQVLLMAALQNKIAEPYVARPEDGTIADQTASIFAFIAGRSENAALARCVEEISDRLHTARNTEAMIFSDIEDELRELEAGLKAGGTGRASLRGLIPRYHERRIETSAQYIALLSSN